MIDSPNIFVSLFRGDINALRNFLNSPQSNPNLFCTNFTRINSSTNLINLCLLDIAVLSGQTESVRLLLNAGANPESNNGCSLFIAAKTGAIDILNTLLSKGSFKKEIRDNALIVAAKEGQIAAVNILVDAQANPKANNQSAIRAAVEMGHLLVVDRLLALGCDPSLNEEFLLGLAARKGRLDILNQLIRLGCNPNANDEYALRAAAASGHSTIVQRLLELDCDPTANDSEALNSAIEKHYHEIETLLLNKILKNNKNVQINTQQSSHTASVHRSVSDSAIRLKNRYGKNLNANMLRRSQNALKNFVNESGYSISAEIAKRAINRLLEKDYTFADPASSIRTQELLAYVWLAIHDEKSRAGTLDDAKKLILDGLNEIHRGYNLNSKNIDVGGPDKPICAAGTFNKLIEKLQGVHPDARIEFLSKSLAGLKLPVIVNDATRNYLSTLANPKDIEGLKTFVSIIEKIKEEGAECIWLLIQTEVKERMFEEFGFLYANQDDQEFKTLIDAGIYTEIKNQTLSFDELKASNGYKQYQDVMIKKALFPKKKLDANFTDELKEISLLLKKCTIEANGLRIEKPKLK